MKVVLITGSSTGIGQATASHLARQGYYVFASMRNPKTSSTLLNQAAITEGLQLAVIQLNVNDPLSAEQAIKTVLEKTGRLNVLVNNAGIGGGSVLEETPENKLRALTGVKPDHLPLNRAQAFALAEQLEAEARVKGEQAAITESIVHEQVERYAYFDTSLTNETFNLQPRQAKESIRECLLWLDGMGLFNTAVSSQLKQAHQSERGLALYEIPNPKIA